MPSQTPHAAASTPHQTHVFGLNLIASFPQESAQLFTPQVVALF
jgi:hypothetical protein